MAQLKIDNITKNLATEGFDSTQISKVEEAIRANLPSETYNKAVLFLGWGTLLLILGFILLAGLDKAVPDALWGAVGAGIGGLAGIFVGKE